MPAKNSQNVLSKPPEAIHQSLAQFRELNSLVRKVRGRIGSNAENYGWMKLDDVKAKFGRSMRAIRKERGLSQEDLAHVVGLDRSYIGGVERGERNVSLENICRIARALKVQPGMLLDFTRK
jgi:DNA-binding XRE family transcriptional regulator